MNWLAARAYEELRDIFSAPALVAALDIANVLVGDESFPAAAGVDGADLLDQLNAVTINESPGNDQLTYSNIAHHHQAFNIRVSFYRQMTAGENVVIATNDAVSLLLAAVVANVQPITVTGGALYSIEPAGGVSGYDKQASLFWTDVGMNVSVGRFDLIIKAEANN